jgi:hypothetical protein
MRHADMEGLFAEAGDIPSASLSNHSLHTKRLKNSRVNNGENKETK